MGSVGMDYLASVAAFPQPDDKLRTEQLETQGGGNCGNALTACSRLGLQPVVLTKIGNDSLGDAIIAELQDDGVDTSYVMRAEGSPSPFTYIIVDRTGGTRTCIHTPGAPLDPDEVTPEVADGLLAGARLVYFDGRLTEAAVVLAKVAKAAGIPVLVEAERLRPTLEQLLQYADYVVTSAHFPQDSTGEEALGDALVAMAQQLPQARWIVTTLGSRGSVLIDIEAARRSALDAPPPVAAMQEQVDSLLQQAAAGKAAAAAGRACLSKAGRFIAPPSIAGPSPLLQLSRSQADGGGAAAQRAAQAAQRAAAANADFGKGEAYAMAAAAESAADLITARIWAASSAGLRSDDVVDTTGAGDAFIGSLLYGIVTGMPVDRMLTLASVVAACKCSALGARPGLPQAAELAESLL